MDKKNLIVLLVFLVAGCASHPTYYPEEAEVALFERAGEAQVKLAKNGLERGYAVSSAVAVTEHIFGVAKYSISRHGNCDTCSTNERDYVEIAAGLGNLSWIRDDSEILLGIGKGSSASIETKEIFPSGDSERAEADYFRSYLQYNLVAYKNPHFLTAVTLRGSVVNNTSYELRDAVSDTQLSVSGKDWAAYIEPAVTLKGTWKGFSLYWQNGLSVPVSGDREFNNDWLWSVAGVGYRFDAF